MLEALQTRPRFFLGSVGGDVSLIADRTRDRPFGPFSEPGGKKRKRPRTGTALDSIANSPPLRGAWRRRKPRQKRAFPASSGFPPTGDGESSRPKPILTISSAPRSPIRRLDHGGFMDARSGMDDAFVRAAELIREERE